MYSISIGQYKGFFIYGPAYGESIAGQQVEFRMFIEKTDGIKFQGKIIDWAGIGANGEVAEMEGFFENTEIRFVKQYAENLYFDDQGNSFQEGSSHFSIVIYDGIFNANEGRFEGDWTIYHKNNEKDFLETVMGGTWVLHLD